MIAMQSDATIKLLGAWQMDILLEDEKSMFQDYLDRELFNERIIRLNEEISAYTIDNVIPLIQLFNSKDEKEGTPVDKRKPIEIHISSPGGSAYDGWEVVSAIENSKTPVHTYVQGYAMSMALPIYLAGHKKFLGKYATLLYHEIRGGIEGTRSETKRLGKEYDRLQHLYDSYITDRTSVKQETLDKYQEGIDDWYIGFEDAEKYGFFDEVI